MPSSDQIIGWGLTIVIVVVVFLALRPTLRRWRFNHNPRLRAVAAAAVAQGTAFARDWATAHPETLPQVVDIMANGQAATLLPGDNTPFMPESKDYMDANEYFLAVELHTELFIRSFCQELLNLSGHPNLRA